MSEPMPTTTSLPFLLLRVQFPGASVIFVNSDGEGAVKGISGMWIWRIAHLLRP